MTPLVQGGDVFTWITDGGGVCERVVQPLFRQLMDAVKVSVGFGHDSVASG